MIKSVLSAFRIEFNSCASGIPVRFVTNETQKTRTALVQKLHRLGFSMPDENV